MTWLQILQLVLNMATQILIQLHPPAKPGLGAPEVAHSVAPELKKIADGLQKATDAVRQHEKAAR